MTLSFHEEVVNDGSINKYNFEHPNFIGFLTPMGEIINEKSPLSNVSTHGVNTPMEVFYELYNMRYKERYRHLDANLVNQEVKRSISNIENNNKLRAKSKTIPFVIAKRLEHDILSFFSNCYSNPSFSEGIGKREYGNEELLDLFKDVLVQYLGYHYVARTPRTIFTSNFKIYETFYNYLLNDFTIVCIPKMNFDIQQKKYVEYNFNEFSTIDSESILEKEIQAVKRLVPLKERVKYYR